MYRATRANVDEVETEVVEIEAKLDKLVKLCSGMIEAGKAYVSANKFFVNGIRDLSQQCKKDETISECLGKCGESLQEIVNYHMMDARKEGNEEGCSMTSKRPDERVKDKRNGTGFTQGCQS
ncbi:arf-GAP with coiled-coil, ANK repeat and PH domain-containing protein 3 isoform X1 [Tachysurus ichikawai]